MITVLYKSLCILESIVLIGFHEWASSSAQSAAPRTPLPPQRLWYGAPQTSEIAFGFMDWQTNNSNPKNQKKKKDSVRYMGLVYLCKVWKDERRIIRQIFSHRFIEENILDPPRPRAPPFGFTNFHI